MFAQLYFALPEEATNACICCFHTLKLSHCSYEFDFAEFHFGPTDTAGSEHTIDSTSSPLEMYLIYHDTADLDLTYTTGPPTARMELVLESPPPPSALFYLQAILLALSTQDAAKVAAISVHFEVGNVSSTFHCTSQQFRTVEVLK